MGLYLGLHWGIFLGPDRKLRGWHPPTALWTSWPKRGCT